MRAAAKKPYTNSIRLYRTREARKEASDTSNPRHPPRLFLRKKLSFFFFLDTGSSRRLTLSPLAAFNFSNDRLTQYWKLAPKGNGKKNERKKTWEWAETRHFMTTIFTIFLLHVNPEIERSTKGPPKKELYHENARDAYIR